MEPSCVICDKSTPSLTSVFQFKNHQIVTDLIRNVIPALQIARKDKNVKLICSNCLAVVVEANQLRCRSIQSDQIAREENVNNDNPHCRICLDDSTDLVEIIRFRKGRSVTDAITSLCPITVKSSDKLSHMICSKCLRIIDSAADLQSLFGGRTTQALCEVTIKNEPGDEGDSELEDLRPVKTPKPANVLKKESTSPKIQSSFKQVACNVPGCNQYFPNDDVLNCHMIFLHKTKPAVRLRAAARTLEEAETQPTGMKTSRRTSENTHEPKDKRRKTTRTTSLLMTNLDAYTFNQIVRHQPKILIHRIDDTKIKSKSPRINPSSISPARKMNSLACNVCSVRFGNQFDLMDHKIACHPVAYREVTAEDSTITWPTRGKMQPMPLPLLLLKCDFCEEKHASHKAIRRHMRLIHTTQYRKFCLKKQFRCKTCGEKHSQKSDYEAHIIQEHQNYFTCSICLKFFTTYDGLTKHIRSAHKTLASSLKYVCAHCEMETSNKIELQGHIETEHFGVSQDVKRYKCQLCTTQFKRNGTALLLAQHMSAKHDILIQKYKCCDLCGFIHSVRKQMEEHMVKTHMQEAPCSFVCDFCGFGCFTEKDLKMHSYIHSDIILKVDAGEAVVDCSMCHFKATTENEVVCHMEEHREKLEMATMKCFRCSVIIRDFEHLLVHAKSHMLRKIYRCLKCMKMYGYGENLLLHIKKHLKNKCCYCNRSFDTEEMKKKHIELQHRKSKVFLCSNCGASFSHRVSFNNHLQTHLNLPKIRCTYDGCNKEFATRKNLHRHLYSHGEATHMCKYCDKAFKKQEVLRSHIKHIHEQPDVRNFSCNICASTFKRRKDLSKHVKRHQAKGQLL